MDVSLDFLSSVLEEIALEGLDGITLPTLWVRLENRCNFPLALDKGSKSFIWECIAIHKDIELYELPERRPVLEIFDRYQHIDEEFGLLTEPQEKRAEIYPFKMVQDDSVIGSCSTYYTRTCVTSQVRHETVLLMSLNQAVEKWPDSVVLVASSKCRLLCLIGTESNPRIEFTKEQYCLLERIGRARYHGEVTLGDDGLLTCIKEHLHYYISKLLLKGLVVKQRHVLRTKYNKTVTGSLFHLIRFYVQRKPKFDVLLECMFNILKNKPGNRELTKNIQTELGLQPSVFRKFIKRFAQKWFKIVILPHHEMYPDDPPETWETKNGVEKQVRVIQMTRPYLDEETIDEEHIGNPYFDHTKIKLGVPLLWQVNNVIINAGPNGITMAQLREELTLPRLDLRSICRLLIKKKQVITVLSDKGRMRFEIFISKKFESESTSCINFKEQSNKFSREKVEISSDAHNLHSTQEKDIDLSMDDVEKTEDANSSHLQEINRVDVEVAEQNSVSLRKVTNTSGFTAAIKLVEETGESHISERHLKRANNIVEFLKQAKLSTVSELRKIVRHAEAKEGYSFTVDKKSIARLIIRLCTDHRVKIFKTRLKIENNIKILEFVCHPSLETTDAEFKYAIEQAKFNHVSANTYQNATKSEISQEKKSRNERKKISAKKNVCPQQVSLMKQIYVIQPKFSRTKALHMFLCYLAHFYEGEINEDNQAPRVYHNSDSWKRFVPPLPKSKIAQGWLLLSDAIALMPLSIFVKVVNLRYEVPELEETLNDMISQHYLLKHLSGSVRNDLLGGRRYVFMICDIVYRLCHMGLASLGPKARVGKDQMYVYIHRNASIKNTTHSTCAYMHIDSQIEYEVTNYHFELLNDVEKYWIDLESTCLRTPLGKYSTNLDQKVEILDPNDNPDLKKTLDTKQFDGVIDDGLQPGNGLGAAGLDSSLFAHLRRNWVWPSVSSKLPVTLQKSDAAANESCTRLRYILELGIKKMKHPESRVRLQRLIKKIQLPSRKRALTSTVDEGPTVKKARTEKIKEKFRVVKQRSCKRSRKPLHDAKDKVAIQCMKRMRVNWSPEEDSILIMCKVASIFLQPGLRTLVVPYTIVRDVLYEKFPKLAYNKTSYACQRRLRLMLAKSAETRTTVGIFLGESKQDADLVKEFDIVKPPRTREKEWRKIFTTLLDKLLNKFSSTDQENVICLPETLTDLHTMYNIVHPVNVINEHYVYHEPTSEIDIYKTVIRLVLFSSLSVVDNISIWSYTLYKLYEQYPDDLLRSVIEQERKKRLLTPKGMCKRIKYNKEMVPLSSLPYRFSVVYDNSFMTKYSSKLHEESNAELKRFRNDIVHLDKGVSSGCISVIIFLTLSKKIIFHTEIPDQIIVFKTSSKERENLPSLGEETQEATNIPSNKDISEGAVLDNLDEPKAKRQKISEQDPDVYEFPLSESSSIVTTKPAMEEMSRKSRNLSTTSRLAFYILEEHSTTQNLLSRLQDNMSLNFCKLKCKVKSDIEDSNLQSSAIRSVIQYHSSFIDCESLLSDDYSEQLASAYSACLFDLKEGQTIFNAICSNGYLGISHLQLWKDFKDVKEITFSAHLSILLASQLIVRVGIASFRYVGIMHSKSWLVSYIIPSSKWKGSNKQDTLNQEDNNALREQSQQHHDGNPVVKSKSTVEDIPSCQANILQTTPSTITTRPISEEITKSLLFQPRIWRNPDGSLNSSVFLHLLKSVLNHVMVCPGITEEKICKKLSLPLQSIEVLELLDVLLKIGSVFKYYNKIAKNISLFSKHSEGKVSNAGEPGDIVHYESHANATVRMSELIDFVLSQQTVTT